MPIFQDENGLAVKFFIQKDIPQEIQAEIVQTITTLGGRVEQKVPRAGFILVQPGTPEEERLRLCWLSPDRPERFFVPHTYVEACRTSGMLLKQIFILDGQPIRMHIDSSIANVNVRATMSSRILHSGGDPSASAQSAKVILADPNTEVFNHLVKAYQNEPGKYIESHLWVQKCIDRGSVVFTPVVYKNPGGRRAGEERTHFTEEDEEHLCSWIAAKIPFKETGGRTGNRLYQQLCDMAGDPEYSWVTRHTWQSWRERYKKNATRLDTKITEIVERVKPVPGEKGQYGYVRKPEEKSKRPKKKSRDGDEPISAGPSTEELGFVPQPMMPPIAPPPQIPASMLTQGPYGHVMFDPRVGVPGPFPPPPPSIPAEVMAARQSAAEEEDDENDWHIREGQGAPPQWAKRRAEEEEEPPKKKMRSSSQSDEPHTNGLHVVDHAVLAIANEFRFTGEEVKEYYDKCGDMNRTRDRFRRMRQWLAEMPDDDVMPPPPSQSQSQSQPQHAFPGIPAAPPPELASLQS